MDIIERLTLEAAQADTMLACEHRQRYGFAAALCAGRRVLDLCCGSGYGTAILAERALEVVGVDNDAATIDTARATIGSELANASFELADAVAFLRDGLTTRFDVVVCFEGLEHLHRLDQALESLREYAAAGHQLIASVPNGKMFRELNPFHVTEFGYEEAMAAFARFPGTVMVPQFLAEGSLICPPGASEADVDVSLSLEGRAEVQYANHFLFCVNFPAEEVQNTHRGRIQLNTSPLNNRWAEGIKHGFAALRRENARLARGYLGKGRSAAASAVAKVQDLETAVAGWQGLYNEAEMSIRELQRQLTQARGLPPAPTGDVRREEVTGTSPRVLADGPDPNSWEHRRRRAGEVLIPWIEQTVPLRGKTVLEYGCGNAAVSCAFAERTGRVIGVDIDAAAITEAEQRVRQRKLKNVELELHPVDEIREAVSARSGTIDVFLLYAVLEHLTIDERLAVLRLARECVKPDGAIVVCETPNRLIYFDHHTAQMPFFHLLPDELAAQYFVRSQRADFVAAMNEAAAGGPEQAIEAVARWGRGVSFHEFELVFDDLSKHVMASNYDLQLFGERPAHPDEVILARYLDRWRPDLAPVWSRYWLDLILSPAPLTTRPQFLRPWSAETVQSREVGWTREEDLHLGGPSATLEVDLPVPSERLVLGTRTREDRLPLDIHVEGAEERIALLVRAPAGETTFTPVVLPSPAQRIAIKVGAEAQVVFVGYDA